MADAGSQLAAMLKKGMNQGQEMADLVLGVVTGVSPLKIRVENRFEISEDFLILSQMVRRKTVTYIYPKVTVEDGSNTKDRFTIPEYNYSTSFYIATDFERAYPEIKYWYYNGDKQEQLTTSTDKAVVTSFDYKLQEIEINIPERSSTKDFVDDVTHTKVTVEDEEREIVVWEDLKVGEEVRMIRSQGGQTYYVLDRKEG